MPTWTGKAGRRLLGFAPGWVPGSDLPSWLQGTGPGTELGALAGLCCSPVSVLQSCVVWGGWCLGMGSDVHCCVSTALSPASWEAGQRILGGDLQGSLG